jgi:pimeloyl-ACP methyl ester carboxylesterase
LANFVLVHGAWHGAWCWARVLPLLARAGHRAHAVTLTGLGDRSHLLNRDITLETHIADVMQTIESEELRDVVLVGHSYAGMLVTAVADRMTDRLAHLVYVDAVVPKPGEAWGSTHAPATREARLAAAKASPQNAFPVPDPAVFGLVGDDHAWVQRRQTPQPAQPYEAPLQFDVRRVASLPRTFISCTAPSLGTIDAIRPRVTSREFWGGAWLPGSRVVEMKTGHDPMVTEPAALAEILLSCVAA